MTSKNRRTRLFPAALAAIALAASGLAISAPSAHGAAELTLVPKAQLGGSGHAGLYGWGAATMCDGSVLVGDYWNMRVRRFAADGTPLPDFIDNPGFGAQQHQAPYGLAVDPDNCDVYMADTDRRQVDRYDRNGKYLNSLGTNGVIGETPTTFRYASRVAVHGGLVYVADTWAHRISVWKPDGTRQEWEHKGFGSQPGQIKSPHGMSFDSAGRLHVVDAGNKRVSVFKPNPVTQRLEIQFTYGSAYDPNVPNPAPGAVMRGDLRGIAIDPVRNFAYVVDAEGNRVHKFTTDGVFQRSIGVSAFTDGGREATVDHAGNVWVGDMPQFQVQKISPDGPVLATYPAGDKLPPKGGFNGPRGAAVDPTNGNIFVSDTYNFRVQKLDSNGNWLTDWGSRGRSEFEFNYPRLIAVHPTEHWVVLADTDNHRIKKYDANGKFLWEFGSGGAAPGLFKNPHGVDVGPDGKIYVADTNNSRVQVVQENAAGVPVLLDEFGGLGNTDGLFRRPRGIVADDVTGQIYVADAIRKNVQVFDSAGNHLQTIGAQAPAGLAMGGPFDIEVDAKYLYVADTPRNKIVVWNKVDGRWVGEFGGGGTLPGKLSQPQGLDLVGDMLYITEQNNERISKWQVVAGDVAADTAKPATTVSSPTANQVVAGRPVTITGSASDNRGVWQVDVAVKEQATGGRFWNPESRSWQTAAYWMRANLAEPGGTTTGWSASFDDTSLPSAPGAYILQRRGMDSSGNKETVVATKFKVQTGPLDTTDPTSVITSPSATTPVAGRPVTVTGSASDDVGVGSVEVAIQHRTSKQWWNPGARTWMPTLSAQGWGHALLASEGSPTTGWRFDFDDRGVLPPNSDGKYRVQHRVEDTAGNVLGVPGFGFTVTG